MMGKICLVTGATSGIGKVTAKELANQGATVVLVARDRIRGMATADEIRSVTGNGRVDALFADLSSQAEIRKLATEFKSRYTRLHVLVNNAGSQFNVRTTTIDGLERTFAVNHLAYFLLTNLLLETLVASAPARVINVASGAERAGHIDFDDLQGEKKYGTVRSYAQSKLANVLFTYELARRLEHTGVTVNTLHPGGVRTGFGRNNSGAFGLLVRMLGPFLLTPEQGAETSIYLATSSDVDGVTGKYFVKKRVAKSAPESHDRNVARQLWDVSERLTGLARSSVVS
jgi:NAD(P)-dependent dehydrogenase (short-subunit alcohol dehydrogenase family)